MSKFRGISHGSTERRKMRVRRPSRWFLTGGLVAGALVAGAAGLSGVSAARETADGDGYGDHREVTSVPCDSAKLIAALVRADAAGGGVLRLAPRCVYELGNPTGHHQGRQTGPDGWSRGGSDTGTGGAEDPRGGQGTAVSGGNQPGGTGPATDAERAGPGADGRASVSSTGDGPAQTTPSTAGAGRPGGTGGSGGSDAVRDGGTGAPGRAGNGGPTSGQPSPRPAPAPASGARAGAAQGPSPAPGGGQQGSRPAGSPESQRTGPDSGPDSGSDGEPTGQGEGQEVNRPDDRNLLPAIYHPITIEGRDAVLTRAPNAGDYRFFTVHNGGELELIDITLDNGRADQGGALWVEHAGSAVVTRTTFTRNTALRQKDGGGGAVFNDGHMTVVDSTFRDNTAAGAEGQGGGLLNGGVLTVEKSAFVNNSAGGIGGGMANFRGAADVSETAFVDNHAAAGGGLASYSARTKVWDSRAVGNTARVGGGLANDDATLDLRNLDVRHNTATVDGGGISTVRGVLVLNNSTVTGNTTRGDGSGLYTVRSNTSVRWSEVNRNTAVGPESKGAIYAEAGRLNLVDSRIVDNSATKAPGGLFARDTSLNRDPDTVIAGNRPTDCGPTGSGAALSDDCQTQQHGQHDDWTGQRSN